MADIKISELPAAGPLTGDELVLLSQDGGDATMLLSDLPAPASGGGLLPFPATAANQIDLLIGVYDSSSNFAGIQCTCPSGFVIDWGDGTTPSETTSSSATTLSHKYEWDDIDPDTLTVDGFRQAMAKITPRVAGNNFTALNPAVALNGVFSGLDPTYRSSIIAAQVNVSNVTLFSFNGLDSIRRTEFPGGLVGLTSMQNMFNGCRSLTKIVFPAGALGSVNNMVGAFNACSSLRRVVFPAGSLGNVNNAATLFSSCRSLSSLVGCAIPISFSLANCAFGPAELNEVFTSLPTVSDKTITITGNWGAATCDTSIATAKGWTVAS